VKLDLVGTDPHRQGDGLDRFPDFHDTSEVAGNRGNHLAFGHEAIRKYGIDPAKPNPLYA
jgi:hypothetical protein